MGRVGKKKGNRDLLMSGEKKEHPELQRLALIAD
jgi:hypothetical protein